MTPLSLVRPNLSSPTRRSDSQRGRDILESLSRSCSALQATSVAISQAASRTTSVSSPKAASVSRRWWNSTAARNSAIAGAGLAALVGLAAVCFAGCATVKAIETACKPATADEAALVLGVLDDPTLANAEAVAMLEASKVALCAVTELAKAAIHSAAGVKLATSAPSPRAVHANAWLKVHP